MRDGLNPYGSASAAYANQIENEQLTSLGEVAQKILKVSTKLGGLVFSETLPGMPQEIRDSISSLSDFLATALFQGAKLNLEAFAYSVLSDLQRLGESVDQLSASDRNLRLFLQGAAEARVSAIEERTKRLASVVVSGIMRPSDPEEMTVEFLRITAALTETDTFVLRIAADLQVPAKSEQDEDEAWRTATFVSWSQIRTAILSKNITEMNVRSALVRLQALGLVEPMDPGFGGGRAPCQVLDLGRIYIEYLRGSSAGVHENA